MSSLKFVLREQQEIKTLLEELKVGFETLLAINVASSGGKGYIVLGAEESTPAGYNTAFIMATEDSTFTATAMQGDDPDAEPIGKDAVVPGRFSAVTCDSGEIRCYQL
jgi:hypothetical protein